MTTVWEQVSGLEGKTLATLNEKKFDITEVGEGYVKILVRETGKPRTIPSQEFIRAEELGVAIAGVRPKQIRESGVSEANPAYVAAIIREILK
jgi:hypothetical protein